jgi:hypothetical protein
LTSGAWMSISSKNRHYRRRIKLSQPKKRHKKTRHPNWETGFVHRVYSGRMFTSPPASARFRSPSQD